MRIAVTGPRGRLGRALVTALEESPFTGPFGPIAWDRHALDLDAPTGLEARLAADGIEVVVHTAGMTDRSACDADPALALRRQAGGTAALAAACAARGVDLVVISCGSIFGGRPSATAHAQGDEPAPSDAFAAACLAAERAALEAWSRVGARGQLGIVRTGPLFGVPGRDLPSALLAAATDAAAAGRPLVPPWGPLASPTHVADLAEAICELIADDGMAGIHHLVNAGAADPAAVARELVVQLRLPVDVGAAQPRPVPAWTAPPATTGGPPAHEVLVPTLLPSGEPMRHWREALAGELPALRRWQRDGVAR